MYSIKIKGGSDCYISTKLCALKKRVNGPHAIRHPSATSIGGILVRAVNNLTYATAGNLPA